MKKEKKKAYKVRDMVEVFLKALDDCIMMIVYDLETTGFSPVANHIIQISARKCFVSDEGLEEAESRNWYINPGYSLPEKIVEITGITDDFLADKPTESAVARQIIDFFGHEPVTGYNNERFDDKFMVQLFERYGASFSPDVSLDLYSVIKDVIDPGETENKKLPTVTKYFGLEDEIAQFHNSDGDTLATLLCFNKCIELCHRKQNESYQNQIKCTVKSIAPWQSPKDWKQKRIYVETDGVTFWFDVLNRVWNLKEKTDRIARYDMADIIQQVYAITGCADENAFAKLDRRVTNSEFYRAQ